MQRMGWNWITERSVICLKEHGCCFFFPQNWHVRLSSCEVFVFHHGMNCSIITDTKKNEDEKLIPCITKGLWKCVFTAVMSSVNARLWCLLQFFHFDILCFSTNNYVVYQFYTLHHTSLFLYYYFHPKMNVRWYLFKKIAKSLQALSAISWIAPGSTSCRGSWSSLPMATTKPLENIQRSYFKKISEPLLSCSQLLLTGHVKSQYIPRKSTGGS